jgi:hypothetical protein
MSTNSLVSESFTAMAVFDCSFLDVQDANKHINSPKKIGLSMFYIFLLNAYVVK